LTELLSSQESKSIKILFGSNNHELYFRFNVVVESNSTAVFIQKSVKNYVSFVLQMLTAINVIIMLLCTLYVGELSIYNYLFCTILYYLIIHHSNVLIVEGYIEMITMKCKQQMLGEEIKGITNNKQVSLLYEPAVLGDATGITIDFKDVVVNLCGKRVLEIHKLHIEKGSIVGVTGKGSHLLSTLLFKLLRPTLGVIFIGNQEISLISQDSLHSIISVIPFDLHAQDLTIAYVLSSRFIIHLICFNFYFSGNFSTLQIPSTIKPS
jgi:ABC-type multidrug transport system fused ATPase/permease subunit